MENRRRNDPNSSDKPFNRNQPQNRTDNRFNKEKSFQPRDNQVRQKDDRFPPREGGFPKRDGGYQPRDGNLPRRDKTFQPREGGFPKRDGVTQPKEGGFQRRESGYQKREGGYTKRDSGFPARPGGFQKREGGAPNRPNNRFDSKKRIDPKSKVDPNWKKVELPKVYSEMQVTDGKHRGKFFQSTTSPKFKPTTRQVRETMFKMISRKVRGKRFLDLCAGSGAVGIEAISRGALLGTFVDRSAKMCSFVKKNMAAMEIKEGHGELFEIEVVPFLKKMQKRRRFWDVVFLDPPYDADYDEILEFLSRGVCVKPRGTFIIEHHAEMFFPERLGVMKRWRVVVEGESALSFYERI